MNNIIDDTDNQMGTSILDLKRQQMMRDSMTKNQLPQVPQRHVEDFDNSMYTEQNFEPEPQHQPQQEEQTNKKQKVKKIKKIVKEINGTLDDLTAKNVVDKVIDNTDIVENMENIDNIAHVNIIKNVLVFVMLYVIISQPMVKKSFAHLSSYLAPVNGNDSLMGLIFQGLLLILLYMFILKNF